MVARREMPTLSSGELARIDARWQHELHRGLDVHGPPEHVPPPTSLMAIRPSFVLEFAWNLGRESPTM